MNVKLINYSYSENKTLLDQVAFCARVSNPENQNNTLTNDKLIQYMIKHKHWSPFEMVNVCLEIETTRDIARQILRHRSFSFQEFSQRYADVTQLGFESREVRLQDTKNRQNSIENDNESLTRWWDSQQEGLVTLVMGLYKDALEMGIAKEQARAILPEGITVSRLYMNGTLRSWMHYIQLRTDPATQKEHRDIAFACVKAIEPIFPMVMEFVHKKEKEFVNV